MEPKPFDQVTVRLWTGTVVEALYDSPGLDPKTHYVSIDGTAHIACSDPQYPYQCRFIVGGRQ